MTKEKELETIKKLSAMLQQALELLSQSVKQNKITIKANISLEKMIDSLRPEKPKLIKEMSKEELSLQHQNKFKPDNYIG